MTHLKFFLKEETNLLEHLKLSEYLKTHNLVEETHIVLDNLIELENPSPASSFSSFRSQRKYAEIMRRLASFKRRWDEN